MVENDDKTVILNANDLNFSDNDKKDELTDKAPKALLKCLDSSQIEDSPKNLEFSIGEQDSYTVGRGDDCNILINSKKLSRKHCTIYSSNNQWCIEDLNSTNGVFINGQRAKTAWLKHKDNVKFGPIEFEFVFERPDLSSSDKDTDPAQNQEQDNDDDVEKTMMLGNIKSSEVFLQAAKEADEQTKKVEKEQKEENQAKDNKDDYAPVCCTGKIKKHACDMVEKYGKKNVIIFAVVILALLISLWYPSHMKRAKIENTIHKANKISKRVIDNTRSQTTAQIYTTDYESDLIALNEMANKISFLAKKHKGEITLVNMATHIEMLEFEREFAKAIEASNYRTAQDLYEKMDKKISQYMEYLPNDLSYEQNKVTKTVYDLTQCAKAIIEFRKFVNKYPEVKITAENIPQNQDIERLEKYKSDFITYRRSHNSPLSVKYLVFKNLIDDVDKHDISLFDDWITLFVNNPDFEKARQKAINELSNDYEQIDDIER